MTRSRIPLIICCLVFKAGALLFPAGAAAIPEHPDPLIAAPGKAAEAAAGQQVPAQDGSHRPAAEADSAPKAERTRASIPCMYAFSSNEPQDNGLADDHCNDANVEQSPMALRFGRRLGVGNGILGETDGIRVDYRLTGGVTLNAVAGFPVVGAKDEFNIARQFVGFSADSGTLGKAWDVNAYVVEQQDKRKLDSAAMGGSVRYRRARRSLLFYVDYDRAGSGWNALMASGAWKLPGSTTISASFDIRNSPIHKRQKKYLQHVMAPTAEWQWAPPSARIKHYTKKGDREVSTLGLSLAHAFPQGIKLTGNVAVLDVADDTVATSEMPREYFYQLKLSGKDLVLHGDRNKLDIRHSQTDTSRISSASIDTKYAINRLWNISPRLRTDYRNNVRENAVQWVTSPAIKMEYRGRQQYGFQVEAGGKWANRDDTSAKNNGSSYFLSLGYQAKF